MNFDFGIFAFTKVIRLTAGPALYEFDIGIRLVSIYILD